MARKNKVAKRHLAANIKYRAYIKKKYGYLFCESCGVNKNGTMGFSTHHIMKASRYPKHKNLHNFKNLICLCIQCHNDFHASKRKEEEKALRKERGLEALFNSPSL
jgi:predicted HNH restriction endonuclease